MGRRQLNQAPCIIPSLTSLYFRHSMSTHPRGPVPAKQKTDLAHRTRLGRVWICALLIDAGMAFSLLAPGSHLVEAWSHVKLRLTRSRGSFSTLGTCLRDVFGVRCACSCM